MIEKMTGLDFDEKYELIENKLRKICNKLMEYADFATPAAYNKIKAKTYYRFKKLHYIYLKKWYELLDEANFNAGKSIWTIDGVRVPD